MVKRIDHLGIATNSVKQSSRFYRQLGLSVGQIEEVKEQKVRVLSIKTGETNLELLEPTESDSPIARFLEKKGEGIHHIALEVEDLEDELERLKKLKIQLIDEKPRKGAEGKRIAFVHPSSSGGVLIELCERTGKQEV